MLAASPDAEAARDFLVSPGEMLDNSDGREYKPTRPAQKPGGDFGFAKEMPGDGDGQKCWPPHSTQKPHGTSWRRRVRCQATATAESLGRRAPAQKPHGDFVVTE